MRRHILTLALVAALVPSVAAAASGSSSWAKPQIAVVVAHGLMGTSDPSTFRPDDPLTKGALDNLATGLAGELAPPAATITTTATTTPTTTTTTTTAASTPSANAGAPVTMAQLDARLVGVLSLGPAASAFARSARAAGLQVPSRFGTEVVARLLGLRTNHPAGQDALELRPNDPATRAEAAYSAAQILGFRGFETTSVAAAAQEFALPTLTPWQQRILDTAVRLIGYPYVWGGTSENTETEFGVTSRGGFDCSGFVWRVYKLQAYADEGTLASTLRGRTTYQMSGEVPKTERIAFANLEPGDVLFWGAKGPKSKPSQVDHAGIYLGNGWFIHSSDYGVALAQLQGWYRDRFAWGRRPLAEAGLE
jgi:cell wall-associated NlpC family hydrolase